jgi:hypothetical protein
VVREATAPQQEFLYFVKKKFNKYKQRFLVYYAESSGNHSLTFRDNVSAPSSWIKKSEKKKENGGDRDVVPKRR